MGGSERQFREGVRVMPVVNGVGFDLLGALVLQALGYEVESGDSRVEAAVEADCACSSACERLRGQQR
jgi:hypothetical protein